MTMLMAVLVQSSEPSFAGQGVSVQGTGAGDSATFKNLAPGEYQIAAFPKMDPNYAHVAEFRSRFNAQKIGDREGSNETVAVDLIPKSAIEAEVAKLQ
jgi:hypothetical protein